MAEVMLFKAEINMVKVTEVVVAATEVGIEVDTAINTEAIYHRIKVTLGGNRRSRHL
ncbi:MAG: hypothetical protein H7240_02120 [Glaciimonas sp.]|nr:hypothetical protein [Glaciimonas sp.]